MLIFGGLTSHIRLATFHLNCDNGLRKLIISFLSIVNYIWYIFLVQDQNLEVHLTPNQTHLATCVFYIHQSSIHIVDLSTSRIWIIYELSKISTLSPAMRRMTRSAKWWNNNNLPHIIEYKEIMPTKVWFELVTWG